MEDAEKVIPTAAQYSAPDSGTEVGQNYDHPRSWSTRVFDSFKRDPNAHATPPGTVGADGKVFDVEGAVAATAESPLSRHLKGRHLQMIAIGGSIGEFYDMLLQHSHADANKVLVFLLDLVQLWPMEVLLPCSSPMVSLVSCFTVRSMLLERWPSFSRLLVLSLHTRLAFWILLGVSPWAGSTFPRNCSC